MLHPYHMVTVASVATLAQAMQQACTMSQKTQLIAFLAIFSSDFSAVTSSV